jgi:hypothetical protein
MKTNYYSALISKYFIFSLCVFMVLLMIVFYLQGHWIKRGELIDADCYTRLNRVVQLHETGKWYDTVLAKSNAPYGEHLHWTRPLDLLLLTGALIATPWAGFKDSLFWWGVLISPFLLIASLIIIPWAFRPVLNDYDSNLMRLLLIPQLGIISYYSVARPDHNSLLGFTFIITTGLILRLIHGSFNKTICYIAGMMSAFSLWLHVESMLPVFWGLLLLGVFWISEDEDFDKKNMHYSTALFVFIGVVLILERPWSDLTSIEYDKISVVHLFVFGLISLFWIAVSYLRRHTLFFQKVQTRRFAIASLGAAITSFCVWLIFPDFYRGGYANVDPRILSLYLNRVDEVQSPLNRNYIIPLIQLLGSAVIGIFYIVFVLRKEPDNKSKGWIFILSGILLFSSAGILSRRLLLYGNIITVIPLAALLGSTVRWEKNYAKSLFRFFIIPFTIISFCIGFLLLGYICDKIIAKDNKPEQEKVVIPLSALCDELHFAIDEGNARKHRILAFDFYGPEIMYRTGYEVIATPFHRNTQGILDAHGIMTATSDEKAHALIRQRGIDMILVLNDPGERRYYSSAPPGSIFYDHLKEGNYPYWIKELELSPFIAAYYKLFRVTG